MEQSESLKTISPGVFIQELDRSSITAAKWTAGNSVQAVGRALRGPRFVPTIVKRGRCYTREGMPADIPRSLLFKTKRAAKKYFSAPISVRSPEQFTALFNTRLKRDFGINVAHCVAPTPDSIEEYLGNKNKHLADALGLSEHFLRPKGE